MEGKISMESGATDHAAAIRSCRAKSSARRAFCILFSIAASAAAIAIILSFLNAIVEPEAHISPPYPMVDLMPFLSKPELDDADYKLIFRQTGLGRQAVDDLKSQYGDWIDRILDFQENFYREVRFTCKKNSPVSREEHITDNGGNLISGTGLAPLRDGDILITKSSHTYGWRNGHCAVVIDAAGGKTLESVVLGTDSTVQDIRKWTTYPNFMLFRLKGAPPELGENIARTAAERLAGIPYDLTVGILSPKYAQGDKIRRTHCSHLVWQVYRMYGFDLDSDGGPLVTPNDIANSPLLEVVQVYGVDPDNIWP